MNIFNFKHAPNRLSGVASIQLLPASAIRQYPNRSSPNYPFEYLSTPPPIANWKVKDGMKAELKREELIVDSHFPYDSFKVKVTFRLDTASVDELNDFVETNLRNRHLAMIVTLENGQVYYLVPMVCQYTYSVPPENSSVNITEFTFTKAKPFDAYRNLIQEQVKKVSINMQTRIATFKMLSDGIGYEYGASRTNDINTVTNWRIDGALIPPGNGRFYLFIRLSSEPSGYYVRSIYFVNIPYYGAILEIQAVFAEQDTSSLINFWEDVTTDGIEAEDTLSTDWDDITTDGTDTSTPETPTPSPCTLEIKTVIKS